MATKTLAAMTSALRYEDLPPLTVEHSKQFFLDWLGNCMRGSETPAARILRQTLRAEKSASIAATVFAGIPFRTSAMQAALMNGSASHSLDFDDLHNASILHPATVIMSAALAVAERENADGRALIAAIVAGYEAGTRVGEAVNPNAYYYWHTTGTAGIFGAAAAAGNLLRLSTEAMISCLGSAGTQAAGLWEFLADGAMSKTLHAGKAAMGGILSADLANAGFTAATQILEGEKGFCRAMTPTPKLGKLTENRGKQFKLDETSMKPYACCKHCHSAIYAAIQLTQKHKLIPNQINSVCVKTNQTVVSLVDNLYPQTPYGHKFSLQYCVAAAIIDQKVELDTFAETKIHNPDVQTLMHKITLEADPALQAEFEKYPEKWAVRVCITLETGITVETFVPYPKGDPQNPVTYAETEAKFRSMTQNSYSPEIREEIIRKIRTLETVPNMAEFFIPLLK